MEEKNMDKQSLFYCGSNSNHPLQGGVSRLKQPIIMLESRNDVRIIVPPIKNSQILN